MIRALKKRILAGVSLLAVTGLVVSGIPAQGAATPGVTKDTITLGMSSAQSGAASPGYNKVGPAMRAYFNYINEKGGVYGRKIELKLEDDKYVPTNAVNKVNKLILRDKVFALVGNLGTATHTAALKKTPIIKQSVPDLFVNTGYSGFANPKKYPTTFMYLPSYIMEAKIMAKYIKDKFPGKKVGILYQDDDFGKDGLAGFKAGGLTFVAGGTQKYASLSQATVGLTAQMTALKSSGAEVIILFGVTSATAVAMRTAAGLGYGTTWGPQFIMGSVGADPTTLLTLAGATTPALQAATLRSLTGALSLSFLPAATDTEDEYVKKFIEINTTYNKGVPWDNNVLVGMNQAMLIVQALRAAGENPTRASLISALKSKGGTFAS
ncbi:MAG: ABC transporter substrate-binding protein, partial [Actinobacteria bacterium]|nr:ABC transporter substrate-binding protein [Actinomycetota bacterium]